MHPEPTQEATPTGDVSAREFRAAMHRVADLAADYLENVARFPVVPPIRPGDVRALLPASAPDDPEPLERILDDYQRLIEPHMTHWNHPGFLAYFAITGSRPGVLGETLAAALNVNAMLWRTGPAATELEEHCCDWLRQMVGLPAEFRGHINDTASISSLLALAAARDRAAPDVRQRGLSGRGDLPALRVYCSDQAHSSIDKAAVALGIGLDHLRRIASDEAYRLDVAALERALAEDRAASRRPIAIVATAGSTSTTSVDPLPEIARIARREGVWLHVDAAYAGSAGVCPEYRALLAGWEAADSIVFNPHKWMFVPVDCSVLLVRSPEAMRRAFSIVPDYLKTTESNATNLMDYGVQLGRRFRALKLWMVLRAFGVRGLQARIRAHCALAQTFARWVADEPGWQVAAPVPFSTVCFCARPRGAAEAADELNERILAEVNAAGPVFLSSTRLRGRVVLRLTVGNLATTEADVAEAWRLLRQARG